MKTELENLNKSKRLKHSSCLRSGILELSESNYLKSLDPYAFAEVDKAREKAEKEYPGEIIDFGVGDPTEPTPSVAVAEGIQEAVLHPERGYPSYEGESEFRKAVSNWFEKRFGIKMDPETEITATLGSKQAVFALPMAYVNPEDVVLIPDPGYPPYTTGAKQRGANIEFMPLTEENDFLPDLDKISSETVNKAKLMWINYPNNPTTKIATEEFFERVIEFCEENNILLISDEAYSEMYYEEDSKPISLFNVDGGLEVGLVFHSLSKRSNMTNYRIGFVTGRKELLDPFKEVQTNLHSGQAQILQSAAVGALSDEEHVEKMREFYKEKKEILQPALKETGFSKVYSEGTFYMWAKVPEETSSLESVKKLLNEKGLNTTPGKALAKTSKPGKNFVRFALVPSVDKTQEAADRLKEEKVFA